MTKHNSSSDNYDTNTDAIPNDTMELYDWIVPLPWWHVTTSSWGPMWGVHVYGMAACYALLTVASAATYAHFRPKTKRLGVVLPLLTFLVLVGGLRLAFCLTRPYDFKDTLVGALSRLLLHLVSPFLCGAYALTQAMLSKITGLAIGSRRFRNAWVVLLGVAGLVVCTVTTHGVVLFHRPLHILLMVDSVVSVAWLLYLSVKFTCSGFLLMQFALDAEVARKCLLATRDRRRNRELSAGASSTGCLNFLCDLISKRDRAKGCRRYHNVSGDECQTRPTFTLPPSPAPSLSGVSPEYPLDGWDTLFEYSSPDTEFCFQDCGSSNGALTDEPVYRSIRRCKRLSLPTEKDNSQYLFGRESTENTRAPFLLRKFSLANFVNERKPSSAQVTGAQDCRRQRNLRVRGVMHETKSSKRKFETRTGKQYSDSSEPDMSNSDSDSCQVSCHHHCYHTRQACEKEKYDPQNLLVRSRDLTGYCDKSASSLHEKFCNECKVYRENSSDCNVRAVREDVPSEASFKARKECEKNCGIGIEPQDARPQGHNISLTDARKTHSARQSLGSKERFRTDMFCLTEGHDRSILHENVSGTITTQNPADVVRKSKTLGKVDKGQRMIVKKLCEPESPRGFPFTWKCHGSINTKRMGECAPVQDGKRPRHAHGRDMVLRILRLFLKRWRGHVSDRPGIPVRHLAPRERCRQVGPDAGSATSNDDNDDSTSSCEGDAGYLADNEHTQSPLISMKREMRQVTAHSALGNQCPRPRYQVNFFRKMSTGRGKFREQQRTGVVFQEERVTSEKGTDDMLYSLSATGLANHPGCLLHSETSFTFLPPLPSSPLNIRGPGELKTLGTSGAGSFSYSPSAAQEDAVGQDGTFSSDHRDPPRGQQQYPIFTESSDSLELCWNVLTGRLSQKSSEEHDSRSPKASGTNPPAHAQSSTCVGLLRIRQAGMLRRSVQGMYLLTFVNLFACLLNLYSTFGRYGVLWSRSTTIAPEPWSWLAFQTLLRFAKNFSF